MSEQPSTISEAIEAFLVAYREQTRLHPADAVAEFDQLITRAREALDSVGYSPTPADARKALEVIFISEQLQQIHGEMGVTLFKGFLAERASATSASSTAAIADE